MFDQYFPNTAYYDNFVNELRESRSKYQALIEEAGEMTAKREALHKKIESCRAQIVPVLHKYYPVELPSDLREGIRKLSSEVRDYRELTAKKQAMLKGNAEYQARADELTEEICGILLSYSALDQNLQYDSCLRNLRKRFDGYREAMERLARYTRDFESASSQKAQANESLEQFLMKYQLQEDTSESLIDSVDKDIHKRDSAKQALAEAQNKLTTFLEENPGIETMLLIPIWIFLIRKICRNPKKTFKNKWIILIQNCVICVRNVTASVELSRIFQPGKTAWHVLSLKRKRPKRNLLLPKRQWIFESC